MFIASLVAPACGFSLRLTRPRPMLRRVRPSETQAIADCFISAHTRTDPLVAQAYQDITPYCDAEELAASVLTSRTLEVTTSAADRAHPLLGGEVGGAYYRFRAVHDLLGHVATGYGFDQDGEYSAWLLQRSLYTGLARWAAATELHGEISALWTTHAFPEHKAVLLDPHLLNPARTRRGGAYRDGPSEGNGLVLRPPLPALRPSVPAA